jgi:peptidoglycan-associated lipoprotein
MVTRRIKQLFALWVVTVLVSGCASQPAEEASGDMMDETPPEVTTQQPAPPPAPKPDATVRNSQLYELSGNDQYVPVGNDKFYFDFDQALVKREGHAALNKHARFLAANSSARLRLEGHADERGTREYNLALGERRANAVRGYLTSQGAGTYQIEVISYGEEKPAIDGHNAQSWTANRRVELIYR